MLRITISKQGDSAIIRLEGKLIGVWVEELRRCWRETIAQSEPRKTVVDLEAVSFVDVPGQKLLEEMHVAGTKLVGQGVLITYLLNQIEGYYAS
jgi:anti-anti-sigma factor